MTASTPHPLLQHLPASLRGEPDWLKHWTADWKASRLGFSLLVICIGGGSYGAVMGWWRDPLQGLYVGIKFPLILLLVSIGNALLNGMLAPLLGLNLSFRQSLLSILASFEIAAAILGAFSPLLAFATWNAPPLEVERALRSGTYSFLLLSHVVVIAFAGTAANVRLLNLLRAFARNDAVAWRVLLAWLAGNLFLGSQLCWIARPFIGSPVLPVQFLREDAFRGNFFETVLRSFVNLTGIN